MHDSPSFTTFLFTDIEGSTRLWEQEPARMRPAMARHDAIARSAVQEHGGRVVKMTGDGLHAAFDDPLDALEAALHLQQALAAPQATEGVALRVRCGLHAGTDERRDDDYYGTAVNRAARIMSAAHGGQVLVSDAVAQRVAGRLRDGIELRDLGAVRLRDLDRPERVFQMVHPRLRADFPALRSLEATPNNLPHALTSFIGRERELAQVRALLRSTRLATLTGMGGLGKSRLAIEACAAALDEFGDGVWLVELAPLRDPSRVAQAVASVLGVKEEAGRPVIEALERHVRDRKLLIDARQLRAPARGLRRDRAAPARRGRAGDGARDEPRAAACRAARRCFRSPPSRCRGRSPRGSAPRSSATTRYACSSSAPRPRDPASPSTRTTPAPSAAICHRLDGVPLALELAAARVRAMPVEEIAAAPEAIASGY